MEQLRSLELGDLQGLPEPVFIKAMVRRIAGHLRLDADALANQLGTISTPKRKPIITAAASMTASPARRRRGMLLPIVLLIAAGGGGAMLLRTRLAMSPVQTPAESTEKPGRIAAAASSRIKTRQRSPSGTTRFIPHDQQS